MTADSGVRRALLSESEATLRQVRTVLADFASAGDEPLSTAVDRAIAHHGGEHGVSDLVMMLVTTYSEILGVIGSLRQTRDVLEQASVERLRNTHSRLQEVTTATEVAATGILDGVDRALTLVDGLELTGDEQAEQRAALERELHRIMDHLQFQDITAQQLGYAAAVLFDVEQRMEELGALFGDGLGLVETGVVGDAPTEPRCDPDASAFDAAGRQAIADEVFGTPPTPR